MNNNPCVLSCIDGATFSEAVCDYAAWIAKAVSAPITFLHAIEQLNTPAVSDLTGAIGLGASEELLDELISVEQNRTRLLIKKGNIMLESAKKRATQQGVESISLRQRHGSLIETLVDMEEQIRVLVVGIRGEQHAEDTSGIGNQLEAIIRSLHKPILVVNKPFTLPKTIMLAYDGSDAANKALDMVASSPLFSNMPCHLVRVTTRVTAEKTSHDTLLTDASRRLAANGIDVTTAVIDGKIEDALADYQASHGIDLTLMGAFSHTKVRHLLLGSFTAKMLVKTQQPLLLLR